MRRYQRGEEMRAKREREKSRGQRGGERRKEGPAGPHQRAGGLGGSDAPSSRQRHQSPPSNY